MAAVVALGATACDPPPEPSEHVEVTYLDVPEPGVNLPIPFVSSNGAGQVVVGGYTRTLPGLVPAGRDPVAYLVDGGETTRLGAGNTLAMDMSEEGHVVGSGQLTEDVLSEPFRWHEGEWMALPLEGAEYGRADAATNRARSPGRWAASHWVGSSRPSGMTVRWSQHRSTGPCQT